MKLQIKEFARLTGVSVRTLHYYDAIGLLRPARVDGQTGYRFYDEDSLLRMQEILFYRELDFSLKSIAEILSSPHYSKEEALEQQKTLPVCDFRASRPMVAGWKRKIDEDYKKRGK